MLSFGRMSLPIILFMLCAFAGDSERAGAHFGVSISPGLSYSLVTASIEGSSNTFTSTSGTLGAGAELDFSKYGKSVHSVHADLSLSYPTSWFVGYVSGGYCFVHYGKSAAPSPALGVEINSSYRINGFNESSLIPGTQIGIKAGYEMRKHLVWWIGYLFCIEEYKYLFNETTIDPSDHSNTVTFQGTVSAHELVESNRFQTSLSYLF
jgi:hypothetical protein